MLSFVSHWLFNKMRKGSVNALLLYLLAYSIKWRLLMVPAVCGATHCLMHVNMVTDQIELIDQIYYFHKT